jgi:hypothetical protein
MGSDLPRGAEGPGAAARAPGPPPPSGSRAAGLVSLSTSSTDHVGEWTVSRSDLRMRRVRSGVLRCAEAVQGDLQSNGVRYRTALITTTYRPGVEWEPKHLTRALYAMKAWVRRRGGWVRYVARLEFTAAGVPHYHVMVWLPPGLTMPLWDKRGWWAHGMTNAKWARRPVGYLAKYAAKAADWPPGTRNTVGARWFCAGGLTGALRLAVRWACAPGWVKALGFDTDTRLCREGSRWRVGPWLYKSPWRCRDGPDGSLVFCWRGWEGEDAVLYSPT